MFGFLSAAKSGMSAQDAVAGAEDGTVTILDVRDLGEVTQTGIANGAVHIPLMRLRDMADPRHPDFHPSLKTSDKIAVYCASGARSHSAKSILSQLGYNDVHNIGGLSHWVRAGGAVSAS
jgi:rhodanese-related sulfurtransferase